MAFNRRKFSSLLVHGAIGFSLPIGVRSDKLDILILGGTDFVGPSIVSALLGTKNKLCLFNRGITNPNLFTQIPLIQGDREKGKICYLDLEKKYWDVVIDVWPQNATLVEESIDVLKKNAGQYIFISSIAVYQSFQEIGLSEDDVTVSLSGDGANWGYAEEKKASENVIREHFPNNHLILRPGPIKGWRDPAHDLLYWCSRLKYADRILVPGSGMDPLQFIDVNDIGRFVVHAISNKLHGTFNLVGPKESSMTWRQFLLSGKQAFRTNPDLIWASEQFLREEGVLSFTDLPLWAPLSEDPGFMSISNEKLLSTGFKYSDVKTTVKAALKWHESNGYDWGQRIDEGLSRDREIELLNKLS